MEWIIGRRFHKNFIQIDFQLVVRKFIHIISTFI
jgi:hypothetical protein